MTASRKGRGGGHHQDVQNYKTQETKASFGTGSMTTSRKVTK